MNSPHRFAVSLNVLALFAISGVLIAAYFFQLTENELPCPLCLLQRLAFLTLAVGIVLNIRFGPRPAHYGIAQLGAISGVIFSGRQVLLHIQPGDAGYGTPVLGYHYYTWCFIVFALAILLLGLMMLIEGQFDRETQDHTPSLPGRLSVALVILLGFANTASTFVECGTKECPENPVTYELLTPAPSAPLN